MHFLSKQPAPQPGASSSSSPTTILCQHGRHRSPQMTMMLLAAYSMVDESDSEQEDEADREAQEVEEGGEVDDRGQDEQVQEAQESIQEVEEEEESELLRENIRADEEAQDSSSSEEERFW